MSDADRVGWLVEVVLGHLLNVLRRCAQAAVLIEIEAGYGNDLLSDWILLNEIVDPTRARIYSPIPQCIHINQIGAWVGLFFAAEQSIPAGDMCPCLVAARSLLIMLIWARIIIGRPPPWAICLISIKKVCRAACLSAAFKPCCTSWPSTKVRSVTACAFCWNCAGGWFRAPGGRLIVPVVGL